MKRRTKSLRVNENGSWIKLTRSKIIQERIEEYDIIVRVQLLPCSTQEVYFMFHFILSYFV